MYRKQFGTMQTARSKSLDAMAHVPTVFRQNPAKFTVKILRSILISNGYKLRARELRADLLE